MQIRGLSRGNVANIPGAIAGGTQFKQQQEDRALMQDAYSEQQKLQNTQWLAGAAKFGLDNWGQPGILEQLIPEGQRKGILGPEVTAEGIRQGGKGALVKIYNEAVTAMGGIQEQEVGDSARIRNAEWFQNASDEQRASYMLSNYSGKVTTIGGVKHWVPPGGEPVPLGELSSEIEAKRDLATAGATGTAAGTAGVEGTPAQRAVDAAFGKDYVAFTQGGGADAVKNLTQLNIVLQALQSGQQNLTGPEIGFAGDRTRTLMFPEAQNALEQVEEVVQRNLRLILGAQFTEKEGERLIRRAYNPSLDESLNVPRLAMLIEMMDAGVKAKMSAMQFYEQNGTLRGWEGDVPTVADFDAALDAIDKQPEQPEQSATGALAVGAVEDGYVYIGGDPGSKDSWQKAR